MGFPPRWIADVGRGGPDYWTIAGGGWRVAGKLFSRVDDQPSVMTEFTKSLGEQTQIPVPKELIWTDAKICKKQDSH